MASGESTLGRLCRLRDIADQMPAVGVCDHAESGWTYGAIGAVSVSSVGLFSVELATLQQALSYAPVMHANAGVRFDLKRQHSAPDTVRYAITLHVAERGFSGAAEIAVSTGGVRFDWLAPGEPPAWCVASVRAQLRTLWRDRGVNGTFPRRVTRWRPEPPRAAE